MIVIDASALVDILLGKASARALSARVLASGESLHAPHLVDIEIASVLRRLSLAGEIDARRGQLALADLESVPLTRYPQEPLLRRVWALRNNLTAYDAAYVALAEALDATLITRDRGLAAASGTSARIEAF